MSDEFVKTVKLDQMRTGAAIHYIAQVLLGNYESTNEVVGLSVRPPKEDGGEFLITVRGFGSDGTPLVAFHAAFSLSDGFRGLEARLRNGSLGWKIDEWRMGSK